MKPLIAFNEKITFGLSLEKILKQKISNPTTTSIWCVTRVLYWINSRLPAQWNGSGERDRPECFWFTRTSEWCVIDGGVLCSRQAKSVFSVETHWRWKPDSLNMGPSTAPLHLILSFLLTRTSVGMLVVSITDKAYHVDNHGGGDIDDSPDSN